VGARWPRNGSLRTRQEKDFGSCNPDAGVGGTLTTGGFGATVTKEFGIGGTNAGLNC